MHRRDFLRAGLAGGALALGPLVPVQAGRGRSVALVMDPGSDPVSAAPSVRWASDELSRTLEAMGFAVRRVTRASDAGPAEFRILAGGRGAPEVMAALTRARVDVPSTPEALALLSVTVAGRPALVATGADPRGLTYGLLEIADRVRWAADATGALTQTAPMLETPANPVRSVMRQFTSETLDKPWFRDRDMWSEYLSMLARERFNRLHLAFGLGYDSLQRVEDSYLVFAYPFLLPVPGYAVRATNLPDEERDANLDTLRFISEEAVRRGLDFQLGLWMHGYKLMNSPRARYVIEGLTDETHAAYCRDALTAVLRACPAISAVALRIHGESGIAEGSYDFWSMVFDGVARAGRPIEIDLHAKGIDATMIDRALATGMPVNLSPKYWAEHLGMPYHQTAIRDLEMPVAGHTGAGLMTLSEGARVFTRYGYADLLRDDRRYTVRHRVFSGTQRLLLSSDPAATAAYSRMFQFCGSTGADLMEPLTCRGRRGTGASGIPRSGYVDASLETQWDWQKYAPWYRVWGRLLYNPDTTADVWRRTWRVLPNGPRLSASLAQASRILPTITTAHLPSAACDAYWPEVYWNQPLAAEPRPNPYGDTPAPKTFQHVSPLDPQIFSTMSGFAHELLSGERTGKYSPLEVAAWLDDLAANAARDLPAPGAITPAAGRRVVIDVALQIRLGRFFAHKFRAGVLYAIHEASGDRRALEEAIAAYGRARAAWAEAAERAHGVYALDLSASDKISNRGQWIDRLPDIDRDIARLKERLASAQPSTDPRVRAAVSEALAAPVRPAPAAVHQPPAGFHPGAQLPLEINHPGSGPVSIRLYYRHVNQAERYESVVMTANGRVHRAAIPAEYTSSPYPLQYYFEVKEGTGRPTLVPGFGADRMNLPYFVVRRVT